MAKKKKRYGYQDGDENARFAPGGSAASEWEEQQRQSFTMGRTINPSDTSKRFNTDQDVENYKPIKTETYQSYMASKLAQAKANNPKSRVHITANDLSSYSNARAKLYNIDPTANLKSQSEFTSDYKSAVDKKARLNDMVQLAQGLDLSNAQDLVRKSYNDLNAVKNLANTRTNAEGLLKRVEEYRKLYGDSKELKVLEDRAKGIADYINTNAKGGSAVSQAAYEELQAPTIQKKEEVRTKYNALNNANIEEKYGKAGDLGYEGVKNIKAQTPAEAEWKEEKQLQLDPFKKYEDNKKEIESLQNEDKMPLGNQNGVGYQDEQEAKDNRIYTLQDQNAQILSQYAEDIIAKAKLTDSERRKLESGRSFDLSDNEFRWDIGDKAKNEVTLNRKEMIDILTKRGISEEEASLLLDYENELDKENERQAAINAGELRRRTDSELGNLTEDIARTIGQPIISPLERVMGVSGEYAHAEQLGRQQAREKYYEDDAIGKALYDFGETAGTIVGASLLGGAAAVPFTTKAVEDSYYNALDKGATESDAMNYAATNGIMTGIIYGIGLKGVNKLLSKSVKGSVVEGLAKEIVEGKPTSSLGKAILKNVGTNAVKEGGIFAGLTTTTQVADTLNQVINLGKKSDFNQMVEAYKQQGMSEDEAWQNTVLDISKQIGQGALESFASGAIMGAGGAIIGNIRQATSGGNRLPENTLLRSEEGTPLRDSQGKIILDDNGQPIRVQQGLNIDSEGRILDRNISEEVNVTQSENGVPIIDSNGNQVTVNGRPIRAERTTLSGVETYNKLRNEYENARVGLENIQERIDGLWNDYKEQGFSNPEEVADFEKVRAKFNKDYVHVVNKAKAILGEYKPISARDKQDLLEGRKKLEDFREDLETVNPSSEEARAEVDDLKAKVDTQIDNIDTVVETTDIVEPSEIVEPTEMVEPVETPIERAENVDLSNLNDRQAEIAQKGAEYDLPEKAIKSMLSNDSETISPQEYALGYNEFYIMGKSSNVESINDAIAKVPSLRETANRITPQAAGVAFSEGKAEVPQREIKSMLKAKPSGTFKAESEARDMDERYVHRVLENVAKLSGADVLVVDDMSKYSVPKNTQGFAVTDKGKVILQRDTANILGVGVHEIIGHMGKKFAGKSYEVFESITEDIAREDLGIRGFDKNIKDLQTEYKKAGQNISYDEAKEEAVAYLAETMLLNDKIRDKFIEKTTNANISEAEKKHIIQAILDWIKNAINALKDRVANARVRQGTESVLKDELVNADETVDAMIKVLEETRTAFEKAEIGEVRTEDKYSFAGVKSETADLSMLDKAQQLAEEGKSKEEVFKETGWFKGQDGKWRYEIDDRNVKIKDTTISWSEATLKDIIEAKELFKAYPFLKNINFDVIGSLSNSLGQYDDSSNTISLNSDYFENSYANKRRQEIYNSQEYKKHSNILNKIYEDNADKIKAAQKEVIKANELDASKDENIKKMLKAADTYNKLKNERDEKVNKEKARFYDSEIGQELLELSNDMSVDSIISYKADEVKKVILHEMQHAIQRAESFATGASPGYWSNVNEYLKGMTKYDEELFNSLDKKRLDIVKKIKNEFNLKQDIKQLERVLSVVRNNQKGYEYSLNMKSNIYDKYDKEKYSKGVEDTLKFYKIPRKAIYKYMDSFNAISDEMVSIRNNALDRAEKDPFRLYEKTAGEIESRDVESRSELTTKERRENYPESAEPQEVYFAGKETLNKSAKYSLTPEQQQLSKDYDKAVKDNDIEKAAELVKDYAASKGYTQKVYHGTQDFGFTKIDLSKSDDSQTFWATSSYTTAHTYSGDNNEGKTREIGKYPAQLKDLTPKKKIDLYKELSANENMKVDYIGKNDKDAKKNYLNKRLISAEREIYRTKPRTEKAIEKYNILKERFNTFKNKVFKGDFAKEYDDYYKALRTYNEEVNDIFGDKKIKDLDTYELSELGKVLSDNNEGIFLLNDSESYTLESEIDRYIKNYSKTSSGVYDFYANTDNFMTIDAKNENWNLISYKSDNPSIDTLRTYLKGISDEWNVSIEYDKKTKTFTAYKYGEPVEQSAISLKEATKLYQNEDEEEIQSNTRDIAADAMKQNYDGVVIKNVVDNGGRGEDFINPADVYIFFNPVEQVKSADPITYDDNGNVIPLAERFSKDHDDIRYSMANKGRSLSEVKSSLREEVTDRDIERFKAIKEDLGNVLRITKGSKLDTQDTRKMALQLRKNWNVKYNTELMTDELKTIGRLIETKGIQNTDTTDYIKAFVTDVLKSETVVDDNTKAFNSYVRNHKIYLSSRDREQITDYNEFRKSAMGSMRLTTSKEGALSVDEFYEHIKSEYPEYYSTIFDEQYPDSSNLPDLLEWIKTAREGTNLLDMYGDEALDFYTQDVIGAYTNAKVEDITNSKAKRNKLLKDVGEMVDTIEGLNKTKDTANQNLLDQMRKLQSDINQRLDRQRENIVNQYEEKMKDIEAKLENEKNENVKRIKQIKEKQKIRERKQADSRKRTQQRQVIRRTRDRLKTTINKPTIHKYIPIPLQKSVKDLFNSIDLGEQFTTARLNKMRDNAMIKFTGERLEQELANIDKKEQAFNNNLKSFRDTLDKYIKGQLEYANGEKMKPQGDADTYYKPILNMIDNTIEKIGSTSLMKMDLSQLKEVSKTLRAIEKATTERRRPQTIQLKDENGKVLDDYEKISSLAMKQTKKLSKLTNSLLSYQMTGHNTMLAMGGFNPNSIMGQLADDIDKAYIVESKIKQDLNSIWDKVLNIKEGKTNLTMKSEVAQRYNKDDLVDVGFKDIEGKPILLNHDSLIWEYLNLESDDNLTHAARGGISFPDYKKLYGRKSNTQVYSDATRRTFNVDAELKQIQQQINDAYELEDYDKVAELAKNQANILEGRKNELRQIRRNIYKQLTDYDKQVVKAWKQIRDLSTDMLNKYWLKTYGFENFNEEAYWRIVTNPNFIKGSDSGNLQQVITNLSESGSTIARLEGAGNPIISGSALFAVDEYINNTAKLIAYSGLQRDLNAVMRYTTDGYNNLQQKVQENAPKLAENFVTFQQALFGGGLHKEGSRFIQTTRGLAARATLSPNLRVALAQVPSFLGTYRYTDAKAIKNAWLPKNRVKQSVIDKYTPLMYARGASGYSLETSDLRQDTNKFLRTLNKADRAVGGWLYQIPNKMDAWTVRHTFGAYLDYVRRNYNLEEGTKEQIENGESPLYKKAAELFNEGTLRTQPMFNAFNKNVLQLDDSELKKTLTIFHTQPFQYFNLALQDIMEYKYEVETNGKDSAKAKKARRRALKGIAAILGGTALFTLIKIGVDKTIRHKKDDVDPEDVAEQLISSMANMFVLGSTLVDSIYALITKKKQIFDFEIYGTQIINSLIDFAKATSNVIEGKDVNYAYHITNILSNLGIPVANIEKDLGGIYRNIEDYMDNGIRDYSNEMNDKELLGEYILGNKSKDDLKKLGVEINDKTKFSNAVKKLYDDDKIDNETAIKVMEDSGLYDDPDRTQPTDSYIEGKVEWWNITKKYKDKYVDSLDANGNMTAESREIISQIANEPYSNAFWNSPKVKTTWKSYKSPYEKLYNKVTKWKKTE